MRVAAVDCGTNTVRLLIADVVATEGGVELREVRREMRVVRLGENVDATGEFSAVALRRTRVALSEYAELVRRYGVERVRMVATSAARDVANRDEFLAITEEILHRRAEIISGDEEAQLSFSGAVGIQNPHDGPFLVSDCGGGSTELVVGEWDGRRATITGAQSVDIGCVRITERTLISDPPTETEVADAYQFARTMLTETAEKLAIGKAKTWLGVAGTATTLAAIALELDGYDASRIDGARVSVNDLHHITNNLLRTSHAELGRNPAIARGREDVIAGGAVITHTLGELSLQHDGPRKMTVSIHDILDGVALSIAER